VVIPKRIRVEMKDGIMSTNVYDAETGEQIKTVVDVHLTKRSGTVEATFLETRTDAGPALVAEATYQIKSLELETY